MKMESVRKCWLQDYVDGEGCKKCPISAKLKLACKEVSRTKVVHSCGCGAIALTREDMMQHLDTPCSCNDDPSNEEF